MEIDIFLLKFHRNHHGFRYWFVAWSAPIPYLNHWWHILLTRIFVTQPPKLNRSQDIMVRYPFHPSGVHPSKVEQHWRQRSYNWLHILFHWLIYTLHLAFTFYLMLKRECLRIVRSIPWLFIPWLLASPGHHWEIMALNMHNKQVFVFHQKKWVQLPAPFQCWEMLELQICFMFSKNDSVLQGLT